jgi:hypothetical protein
MCSYNRKDAANEDERAINLTEEISVDYQGWFHSYMEKEQLPREPRLSPTKYGLPTEPTILPQVDPSLEIAPCSTPFHQPFVPRSENIERGKGQTLSEILAIPRFDASTSRKKTNNYHCHGRLLTSEGFLAETRAKEEAKRTKEIAIEQKKLPKAKKKKEKDNHRVDAMVKKWIKEMQKKVD